MENQGIKIIANSRMGKKKPGDPKQAASQSEFSGLNQLFWLKI